MIEKLVTKLKSILEMNSLLQVSYSYEREDATGTPFATLTPSANENAYSTTTENERVYAFLIRLFVERKGQSLAENCEATMRALVDSVLNQFDSDWNLSDPLGTTAPLATQTGYTFLFMEATPSAWGYVGRENEYRVAEIEVRCHFSIDVNLV